VRVGIGYDSHRFTEGRRLVLGGVEVPHTRGLAGWSDADVVCHALIDAILGAASLGDIGRMFPSDDPQWKDASSLMLLSKANLACLEYGLAFQQGDVTIIAEEPRLASYLADMEVKIAEVLVAGHTHVSVKAKTNSVSMIFFATCSTLGLWFSRYTEVYPSIYGTRVTHAPLGFWELGVTAGFLGLFAWSYAQFMDAFPKVQVFKMTSPYRDEVQVPVDPETMEPLPAHE